MPVVSSSVSVVPSLVSRLALHSPAAPAVGALVKALLADPRVDPNKVRTSWGDNAISIAAYMGNLEIVQNSRKYFFYFYAVIAGLFLF